MRNPYFPFHALGLQGNPFRRLTGDEWAVVAILPDPVAAAVEREEHLQLLGAVGRGKTTALMGLAARFRQMGQRVAYEYIPEGQSQFHTALDGLDAFLLDEGQRLSLRERERLLGRGLPPPGEGRPQGQPQGRPQGSPLRLIVTSHEDLRPLFRRRSLPLVTIRLDSVTVAHVQALLERRVEYFALGEAFPAFTPDAVRYLHQTFGSDLRAMESFLYEVFHRLQDGGPITAEYLREMG